jgi:hypothetical protein
VLHRGLEVFFSSYLSLSIDRRPLEIIEGIPTLLFCPSFAHARVRADLGCNYFPNIFWEKGHCRPLLIDDGTHHQLKVLALDLIGRVGFT